MGVRFEGTDSANGVSAGHVAHLPKAALVYQQPRRATVLCDGYGSCAMAGHIVVFQKNPAMTMQSYCAGHVTTTCRRRTMWFNSPRMGWQVRVPSHSDGL